MKKKLWLTRQYDGKYMLTELPPVYEKVGDADYVDVYFKPGEPQGVRNLCYRILFIFGAKPLKKLESIQVEIEGRTL